MTWNAERSDLISATEKHRQATVNGKDWTKHIQFGIEGVRQTISSNKNTDSGHHGQDYDEEDYADAFQTLYEYQPQNRAEKQVTFALPTRTKEEDEQPLISDVDTDSSDYVQSINTLFPENLEDHTALEKHMEIGHPTTAKDEYGQSISNNNDYTRDPYTNTEYGDDYWGHT